MVKITLYHQEKPITHHAVSGGSFSVGSHPTDDLVLAGRGVAEQHLTIYQDSTGCWRACRKDGPTRSVTVVRTGERIALGRYTVGIEQAEGTSVSVSRPSIHPSIGIPCPLGWAGMSPVIQLLKSETEAMAPLNASVLILGETGTGKELVAKGLHKASGRGGRFVSLNCGCLTDTLVEDTLFGHEKGAFTDARSIREGVFEQAREGTLLLDEIGEMSVSHQSALLRILEERTVRRIGGSEEHAVNFRLVAATNCNLQGLVAQKRFRADLYYRLTPLTLKTTPLRKRIEDIVPIAQHLLFEMRKELGHRTLDNGAKARLQQYSWPGNVRELRNVLYRVAALSVHHALGAEDFDMPKERIAPTSFSLNQISIATLERFVNRYGGNISKASKVLGVARTTLRDRLNRRRAETPVAVGMTV